jgi:hypothetical protein
MGNEDAPLDPGADPDGSVAGDAPLGPFGPPVHLSELSSPQIDDDPTLSLDMLEMYFASGRPAGAHDDIYRSTRAAITDPWGAPQLVVELSTGASESEPELSADRLTIRISRINGGNGNDIYESTRTSRSSAWSMPVRSPQLSSTSQDYAATEEAGKLVLVMSSERTGNGNEDIFVSRRATATLPWGAPAAIAELNTPGTDSNPFLFEGELAICLDSTRGGDQRDLYIARRPAADAPFGTPVAIEGINSPQWDADCWISPDRRTIFFSSERSGNREIYTASR